MGLVQREAGRDPLRRDRYSVIDSARGPPMSAIKLGIRPLMCFWEVKAFVRLAARFVVIKNILWCKGTAIDNTELKFGPIVIV